MKVCRDLPEGYRKVLSVDPMEPKTALWMNLAALVPTGIGWGCAMGLLLSENGASRILPSFFALFAAFVILMILYLPLHELVHGAVYKLLTGRKLTFGFNGMIAWCGIPDWYVDRRTALPALAAPFVVFSLLFALMALCIQPLWLKCAAIMMLGTHTGSCVGDLYDLWLLLFRLRSGRLLMKDPGPVQDFYLPENEAADLDRQSAEPSNASE